MLKSIRVQPRPLQKIGQQQRRNLQMVNHEVGQRVPPVEDGVLALQDCGQTSAAARLSREVAMPRDRANGWGVLLAEG